MTVVVIGGILSSDEVIGNGRGGGRRAWIVRHLVPPLEVFHHIVAMARSRIGFLVIRYVVLEVFFSFQSELHSRKNSPLYPLSTSSIPMLILVTNLTVLARLIHPFTHMMHFHIRLVMHQIFLQTIKNTLHLLQAARTHT